MMSKNLERFPFRGYHYDIARGAYLRPEYLHEAIRHAASCGYTHFLPYLENMIRLPAMEKACPKVAYTPDDWRAFDRTALEVGIELVPHFNAIGHTEHICAFYPELAGLRGGRELDVVRKETVDWVLSCLESFCSFSQGRHFLIGGDEWQIPNPLLEKYAGRIGELWANHVNKAIEFLVRRERTPLVWHDMLMHYPEALDILSKDAVVLFWFYDEDSDYPVLETFKRRGFRTIMASGCLGHLNRRRAAAVDCAIRVGERHQADGFLMTSWEGKLPWEAQRVTMKRVAERLAGQGCADEAAALSAYALWKRGLSSAQTVLEELDKWTLHPEYRAYLQAEVTENIELQRSLHAQYQYPYGPTYEAIGCSQQKPEEEKVVAPIVTSRRFALDISEEAQAGTMLRFVNGEETFVIYPRYGATLQDWCVGGHCLIAHTLPSFLESNSFAAGGYRSFTRALGFRPIWALGTHHNPNILWQHPFEWCVVETTPEKRVVELRLSLRHVDVRYTIIMEKEIPGFIFEVEALNHLDDIYGGWGFNLPLKREGSVKSSLSWAGGDLSDSEPQWLPGVKTLRYSTPHWMLQIEPEIEKTAGWFVDCARDWITPDLHGFYLARKAGEAVTAQWKFSTTQRQVFTVPTI